MEIRCLRLGDSAVSGIGDEDGAKTSVGERLGCGVLSAGRERTEETAGEADMVE